MNRGFLFFLIILIAVVASLSFWYWQGNTWSKGTLKLEILGPETMQAGEEITYSIKFKNNGKVQLEEPELIFAYPENVIPAEQAQRVTKELDDIYPGEERIIEFRGRIFGKEQDTLKAEVWLTYKPKNLKASYESKTSLTTQIDSVPLTFEFDLPLKAQGGEDVEFSLNYFSNLDYILENLRVKMQYPDDFAFLSSEPNGLDQTEWNLPTLYKVDGGRINVRGAIEGEKGEKKIFKAQLGAIINDKFVLLKETSQAIEITEPSFYVSQMINGSQNYLASIGDSLHYEVFFKNIGNTPVQKKFLFVKLDGDFFDLDSLKTENGDVGRGDNSIIWDWKNVSDLRFLDASEEGKVEFWIKVKEGYIGTKIKNPILKSVVTIGGTEKVFETQLNSKVELVQKAFYDDEVFGNTGFSTPVVGSPTTYTILWQIRNSWNTLENVKIKSILPDSVKPTGNIFPEDAKLTFDSESRELVWNVGRLDSFKGWSDVPYTMAFQVEFIPHPFQKGKVATLIEEAEIIGEDVFTSGVIAEIAEKIDTSLPDDQTITDGVVK